MRIKICSLSLVFIATSSFAISNFSPEPTSISWHNDARKTPKIIKDPKSPSLLDLDAVRAYLNEHKNTFKLKAHTKNLKIRAIKKSLRGTHYYFQQSANGIDIKDAEIIISVDNNNSQVYNIFNNTYPAELPQINSMSMINKNQALDLAWQSLKVHGPLMSQAEVKLEYRVFENKLRLIYLVSLNTQAPFGYFEHIIDAQSGKILEKYNKSISRHKREPWPRSIDDYEGPIWSREFTQKQLLMKAINTNDEVPPAEPISVEADGSALVFDPDPRTALQDPSLSDDSSPDKFENAYVQKILKNLSYNGSEYSLKGPWVTIADFEPPNTSPSTTPHGEWSAKRGDNAFNDTMIYFHIDQNQRYIQSLGFIGDKGIQHGSIRADSDGLNGDDNSHYIPGSNILSFGHGCVDDAQDADVILHEYGHAIHMSINSNWRGGDTGAMGEGFGDYWAASYSITTPHGNEYFPYEVFTWDAHGLSNSCWSGRVLNALDARYNPQTQYSAHTPIAGGFQSDELWSTPLFQSLMTLLERGIPREEVDRIILEAHFGLGANISMREMAQNIIHTAQALYPQGPHAEVFKEKFIHHDIIEIPQASFKAANLRLAQAGSNNSADPGESFELYVPLLNHGSLEAPYLNTILSSSTDGVEIISNSALYENINPGEQKTNALPFMLSLSSSLDCAHPIELMLTLSSEAGVLKENTLHFKLPLGTPWPNPDVFSTIVNLPIPDAQPDGIKSSILVEKSEALVRASKLSVDVDIKHSYRGDLRVTLISPKGTRITLHHQSGGAEDNLIGNYPKTLTPANSFDKLDQEPLDGEWSLEVVDTARMDLGQLNSWALRAEFERRCE